MSEIDDGGAAFPCHTNPMPGKLANAPQGMTLRHYFAAAALQGYFGAPHTPHFCDCKKVALYMYDMADAMLKARKEGA
jgi:hypothetical protein